MTKPLNELDPAKAGVSKAILTKAYDELPALSKEAAAAEKKRAAAVKAKRAAQEVYDQAKAAALAEIRAADAVIEEFQRASWIVRNADPDHPSPPMGVRPPDIKTPREVMS